MTKLQKILLGTGVLAVGAMLFWKREAVAEKAKQITSSGVVYAKGLRTSHRDIKVNDRQVEFMQKLRAATSFSIVPDLVITSGIRDEFGQAQAMLTYLKDFGPDVARRTARGVEKNTDLTTLYKKAATELLALSQRTKAAWAPLVKSLYDRGLLHKSGHYTGGSLDVRGDMNTPEGREIIRAALAAGARAAYDDGPAIHVDLPV